MNIGRLAAMSNIWIGRIVRPKIYKHFRVVNCITSILTVSCQPMTLLNSAEMRSILNVPHISVV